MDKQMIIDIIFKLPDNISLEEIVEVLYLKINIGKRIDIFDKEKTIFHKEFKKEIANWK